MNGTDLPDIADLRERLQAARKFAGLTQAEAASRVNRSEAWLSKLENGQLNVPKHMFHLLARVYEVPSTWLRNGVAEKRPESGTDELRGRCLLDVDLYEKVMAAESLEAVRELLPRTATGFQSQVAWPVSGTTVAIDLREAQAKQARVDEKLKQLVADEVKSGARREDRPPDDRATGLNAGLEKLALQAIKKNDRELAWQCLHWHPHFLDLIVFAEKRDVEWGERDAVFDRAFQVMREFERTFPDLVLEWREQHDPNN